MATTSRSNQLDPERPFESWLEFESWSSGQDASRRDGLRAVLTLGEPLDEGAQLVITDARALVVARISGS